MRTHKHKSARKPRRQILLTAALTFCATLLALPVHSVTMPDIPLQAGSPIAPNIMFILDDSGSMHFEIMPDEYIFFNQSNGSSTYLFPRANGVYGDSDYNNNVATVDSGVGYNALTRSPQVNRIYYNPTVTYAPWAKADGSLYPNASLTCALHNPERPGTGAEYCRDLTANGGRYNSNTWRTCQNTSSGSCTSSTSNTKTYWPATYYWSKGGDIWDWNNYVQVEIRSGSGYGGHGRSARTDCGSPATGTCTYAQEIQNFANWYTYYRSRILSARAGIGRAFSTLSAGTAEAPAPRVGFTTINTTAANGIVRDLRIFSGTDRTNFFNNLYRGTIPAAGTPLRLALDNVGKYYMTDLPWDATPGTSSSAAQLACRASYSILMTDGYWNGAGASSPANGNTEVGQGEPFEDAFSNKLADVAMYYWKTDLRASLDNKVPATGIDTATWQHMVTFGVGLGVTGTIDPDTAFSAIASRSNVPWPEPTDTKPSTKIDDLLHAAVNSRGGFFSASNPTEFADGLSKVLTSIGDRVGSASNVAANSVALKEDTRLFQASYKPGVWTGELKSFAVTTDGIGTTAQWSASAGIPASGRKLFTSTGAANNPGAAFPTTAQTTALGNSAKGHSISAYLAGARTGEIKGTSPETGDLRRREHLLGDIVNSSPAYAKDTDTLYVGANDGMMHAINANTGAEVFAYVPNASSSSALAKLKLLSSPSYSHKFYVDGPITVSSFLDTPAKNYLVGALGRGGKGVYFLDVTTPTVFANANVTGEYGEATGDDDLGYVLGKPIIANLAIGTGANVVDTPVAIVSNGVNSTSGRAGLYVFNLATGKLIEKILTGTASDTGNGLSTPRGWDYDGDGFLDYVYAGDLKGNVWKFDIGGNKTSDWEVAYSNTPLFVAMDAANNRQPITGGLSLALDPVSFKPFVFFGTGKYLEQSDVANTAGVPNTSIQTWYGIKDEGAAITTGRAALQQRTLAVAGTATTPDGTERAIRGFEPHAPLLADKKGWYVDLLQPPSATAQGERMVGDPFLLGRVLVAASIIPSADPCSGGGTGYLNGIDAFTGTSVSTPFFDANGNNNFDDDKVGTGTGEVPVGSIDPGVAMPTSPTIIESLVVVGGSAGGTGAVKVSNPVLKARISWREILRE